MSIIDWMLAIPKALVSYGLSWFMVIAFIAVVVFVIYLITLPAALVDKLKGFLESRSKCKKDHFVNDHIKNTSNNRNKTTIKIIVAFTIVFVAVVTYLFWGHIQYFLKRDKNTIILSPEAINIFDENKLEESIHIYEGDNSESCWHDIDKNIYHVFIDRDVFSSDDESIEITGEYWNYPFTPDVYINGDSVNVKSYNKNKAHDYVYLERQYFFKINFSIVPNKIYKVKIYCKDISENFNIVFHESEESLPYSQEKVYYTPNGTAYHKSKKCIALKNSEHVFRGTTEYVGKTECWLCCK